jgi:uncharacterized protein
LYVVVEFLSEGEKIRGFFFPPAGTASTATVLFLQGFPGVEGDELLCERLAQENIGVLTFNYRGTFHSQGLFSFSNAIADIGAALNYLRQPASDLEQQVSPERIALGGWSFGSGLVPAGAAQHPELKRIFAISGRDFNQEALRIEQDPEYARQVMQNLESLQAPRGPLRFREDVLADLVQNRTAFDIENLVPLLKERDILLLGGWDDSVVAIEEHLLPFYRQLKENGAGKARIEVLQDDHEFIQTRDKLVGLIVKWLGER